MSSSKAAVEVVTSQDFGNPLSETIATPLVQQQLEKLPDYINQSLLYDLNKRFCFLLNAKLCSIEQANEAILCSVTKGLSLDKQRQIENCIKPSSYQWIPQAALLDFCVTVLQCDCDEIYLNALQSIMQHCGWIISFQERLRCL